MEGKGSGSGASKDGSATGGGNNTHKDNVGKGDVMKAPGGDGSYISREQFEKNPQGYFAGLHAEQKDNKK